MRFKIPAKPFLSSSRKNRKKCFIETKNTIRLHAAVLGGKFTAHAYMHGNISWMDAYFLGNTTNVFYNLDIETTQHHYKEMVWDQAWDESCKLVPFNKSWLDGFSKTDKIEGECSTVFSSRVYPEFGDLDRYSWMLSQLPRIANSKQITVREKWSLHHDYAHGIGLHACIDVPFISIDALNRFIDRFLEMECDYTNPNLLSYSFDDIKNWGIDSNPIIDPLEWADAELETPS